MPPIGVVVQSGVMTRKRTNIHSKISEGRVMNKRVAVDSKTRVITYSLER